jgi:hypothetical protein
MGEIANQQNSTIILPIPIDLFKPYLSGPDGSEAGNGSRNERRSRRIEEEKEAAKLYEEAVGEASAEGALGEPREGENL